MQERSEAERRAIMAMPQCCYLAKGAKRPSHTTNTIKFDRIPFDLCNSIKRFDLCPFDQKNSTYLQPPPVLATDPFSILLGARKSTQVTSQTNCLPSSQGSRVIPSGRFPSVRVSPFGSRTEGTLMELSACFTRVLRLWCFEKRPALLAQERP